ncbi:hypothetical protein G647_00939 [Cladophialophora carrionii CBS 160.54]|uniref:Transcription factor TFIIIB component B'' Myb domain-containing protein n=1 Tax=Cladophialophora carrionii CBS 160.54 TaxID=1279043 RepID=V9DNN6_9EURO|nr:uncharacterized protein G647_00939 [Cladophialophora carrionii CBS 160.54]ETI28490.1 hypothetical protein G647_00939 [Cladophialophora carrionii CBS 160.54]
MPSFSSVVRKPGQKIQPRAPKRNIQRNAARHAAPPSLTPESQTVSPAVEAVDREAQRKVNELQPAEAEAVHDGNEIPSTIPSLSPSIPAIVPSVETARETYEQAVSNAEPVTDRVPSLSVEITVPGSASTGIQIIHPVNFTQSDGSAIPNVIPTISSNTPSSTAQKRKATNEPTPAASEGSSPESEATEEPRKRPKTTPAAQHVEEPESQAPSASDTVPLMLRHSPGYRRSESRTSDALIQDATTGAAHVSELAQHIENSARSQRSRSEARSVSQTAEPEESISATTTQSKPRRTKKKKKSKSEKIQELAQQVVDQAVNGGQDKDNKRSRRRSRLTTPENAEELEIDPQEVSMSELVKDIKVGRKSETEKRMQENWVEIKERRKKDVEKRREAARGKKNTANGEDREPEEAAVPKQIIVNGVIVVANESREVAFGSGLEQAAREQADVAIEDDRIYKYVNQATLGKNAGRDKRSKWNEDTTNLFYQGLRMFGTDFSMIANLFPESVDRGVVKRKYLAELQSDPARVDKCVTAKETVSLDEYAAMTNMEFEDPDKLMKELEEEEKRMREEDEKRRADQGYVMTNDGADVPLPSTETDDAGAQTAVEDEEQDEDSAIPAPTRGDQPPRTVRSQRINALAEKVVQAAVASKKKQQRRTRESTGGTRGGRGGKKGKRTVEGIEERIGPLDEVEH